MSLQYILKGKAIAVAVRFIGLECPLKHGEKESLADRVAQRLQLIRAVDVEPYNPWTRCSEGLPDIGEVVQVTVRSGSDRYPCEGYIHAVTGKWSYAAGCGASIDGEVIAWRPKSEPYQGEE